MTSSRAIRRRFRSISNQPAFLTFCGVVVIGFAVGGCEQQAAPPNLAAPSHTADRTAESRSTEVIAETSATAETGGTAETFAGASPAVESDVAGTASTAAPGESAEVAVTPVADNHPASVFPSLAPLPDVPVPPDNPITDAKSELGRLLFFDNRLSGDLGTSCASCHDPRLGWGDGQAVSRGYAGTQHWRNSQTTINSAFFTKLFWAGEVPSLEAQAKSAITGNLRATAIRP